MKRIFLCSVVIAFFSSAAVYAQEIISYERAMSLLTTYLGERVNRGTKVAILNFQSAQPELAEYFIDELTMNIVNDGRLTVVDRRNMEVLQEEMHFQMSGFVSDESAQSIGHMLGAQTIISGSISVIGNVCNLRIRAIGVETAAIQGALNLDININSNRTLANMVQGGGAEVFIYDSIYTLAGKYNLNNKKAFAISGAGTVGVGYGLGFSWGAGGTITPFERFWGFTGISFFLSGKYFNYNIEEVFSALILDNTYAYFSIGGGILLKTILGESQRWILNVGPSIEVMFGTFESIQTTGVNTFTESVDFNVIGFGFQAGISHRFTPNISLDFNAIIKAGISSEDYKFTTGEGRATPLHAGIGLGITFMIPY